MALKAIAKVVKSVPRAGLCGPRRGTPPSVTTKAKSDGSAGPPTTTLVTMSSPGGTWGGGTQDSVSGMKMSGGGQSCWPAWAWRGDRPPASKSVAMAMLRSASRGAIRVRAAGTVRGLSSRGRRPRLSVGLLARTCAHPCGRRPGTVPRLIPARARKRSESGTRGRRASRPPRDGARRRTAEKSV